MTPRLESERFPYLPLRLVVRDQTHEIEALIDTGFDGDVAVPPDVLADGEPLFAAYAPVVHKQGFHDGDELTETELTSFRKRCLTEDYLRRAYYYLGLKDYSKRGHAKKLGEDEEIAQAVVDGLESDGYLDDVAYAARRAGQLISVKKMSEQTAIYTLVSEGIDR
jgi:hypothetical protein